MATNSTLDSNTDANQDGSPVPEELAAALRAASKAPERDDLWDALEETAATLQKPDPVAALYVRVLAQDNGAELTVKLGQRVVRFHDEWFEDALPLVSVLTRVLEADSSAEWAFHRLSMLLTNAERWDELLALYDRALAGTDEKSRRIQLLDEAAHIAKDFAGQADRAIHYLEQLFPLKPSDGQLATSLERLFEKQSRYEDLIKLWGARLTVLPKDAAQATRARIAACWLDHLNAPGEALAVTEELLNESSNDKVACGLLERIVALPSSPPDVRKKALGLLRTRYDAANRGADVVRVLEVALGFATREEKTELHGEIAGRLVSQNRDLDAMGHYCSLVVLLPGDANARSRLRDLAEKTGRFDMYAEALSAAADACEVPSQQIALRVEAANTRCETLQDEAGAIDLYARVLQSTDADAETLLTVARRQAGLLERASRSHEQLDVLERLATLEGRGEERSIVLGNAARLADSLGETDRALTAWRNRLSDNAKDLEALDAMVDILERAERWEPLIESLRQRSNAAMSTESRRSDLVRIARIQTEKLSAVPAAIETWSSVEEAFGQNAETVDALSELLATAERWKDLAKLLDGAGQAEEDPIRRAQLLHRLGDVQRVRLETNKKATKSYREALESDPRNEGARAGLRALLSDEKCLSPAVEALARAYASTDEWAMTLEIVEPRLQVAKDADGKTAVLLEAATIHEQRASDPKAALDSLRRAFPLSPADLSIEREVLRLAEATGGWPVAVDAYREAIVSAAEDSARVADLQFQEGKLLDDRLADLESALRAYQRVTEIQPQRVEATAAVVRVAATIDRWEAVAKAVVSSARARETTDPQLFGTIEEIAGSKDAFRAVTSELESAVERESKLRPDVVRDIETQIALWHRDRQNDSDAAERALLRAVAHDATDAATLRMLADLQRRAPGRPLVNTLLQLAATGGDDHLDALHEAAEIALRGLGDRELARSTLMSLLEGAATRWKISPELAGTRTPEDFASFALEQLVAVHSSANEFAVAVTLLVDTAKLPFSPENSRGMRHQAAEISANQLGDGPRAIDLYRGILDEAADDSRAIRQLAVLYETHERLEDLLGLRRHELALGPSLERRLALRLDIARVLGILRDRDARIATLRDNLAEQPGHEPSIAVLSEVLESESNFATLADTLAEQAARLEELNQGNSAADLWARVATIAESKLSDIPRALESHRRVVALGATHQSLDALARLHVTRGEHGDAVRWLEQRLASTDAGDRAPTVVLLAHAHLGTGHHDRALSVLEQALREDPTAGQVRTLLADLYRGKETWEPLARLLHEGSEHVEDAAIRLAYLREAAEIYHRRLSDPGTAIPIFEKAVALAPQERAVRIALADSLRAADRLDEARAILEALISEFGRRRPPERAAVHYSLAQIARARGDINDALAQLDVAASMDMQHPGIQRMLGDLARDENQFERAEKAYRALLLVVRRQTTDPNAVDSVGASEVLFELYRLALKQEETDRAREFLESAFETASQSESEARRFDQALRAFGDPDLLLRALKNRFARAQDPDVAASILADLSAVLIGLGRVDEALDASLKGLAGTPNSTPLHDTTRNLARQVGGIARYAEALASMAARAKDQGEMAMACDLYLRLGELTEGELGDVTASASIYEQAEQTGERQVESWRALDRVYGQLGNLSGQLRVLRSFVNAGVENSEMAEQTEALYRVAQIELATDEHRSEGVDMLSWALDREPQFERAATMLREAAQKSPPHTKLAELYERVARSFGDPAILLDALERIAASPEASIDLMREAVDIAGRLEEFARAEALLRRTVELAQERDTLSDNVWALVALGERRKAAADLADAAHWIGQAAEVAEPSEAFQLGLELGTLAAGPLQNLELAATTFERLRAKEPGDRNVWEPLLDVYRRMGDREKLSGLIATTLDSVFDSGERNQLRMERAKLLLDEEGREEDAVTMLHDILEEDPTTKDAALLLITLFERSGRTEDLTDLIRKQLEAARDRSDSALIGTLSLKLGTLLEKENRSDAMDIYRAALDWTPEHREILQSLLRLYGPDDDLNDRADTMERLLAIESGQAAIDLCLELVSVREGQSDEAAVARALDRGFRGAPSHTGIRERLVNWYTERADWVHLAELLAFDAGSRTDPTEIVDLLREAALLYRDRIENASEAAKVLQRARAIVPGDLELLKECARALSEAGDHEAAAAEVASALEAHSDEPAVQADLFRVRAELLMAQGHDEDAVADLEQAVRLGGPDFARDLASGLEQRRELSIQRNDRTAERTTIFRLVQVLGDIGNTDRVREILSEWIQKDPTDGETLRSLAAMDVAAGDWDGAARAYAGLVDIEEGPQLAEAALRLTEACEKAGHPGDARQGLERVTHAIPNDDRLRIALRRLYEQIGAHQELADISISDAQHTKDDAVKFQLLRKAGELRLKVAGGESSGAIEPLELALRIRPSDHEATVLLADAYTNAGKVVEATKLLETSINNHKGRRSRELAALQHRMARVALSAGDKTVELAWLNVALDSDMQNGQIASELADVAMELGQTEVALKALRAVTLMKAPGPMSRATAFLKQGMLAHQAGDARKAVFLAKKALVEDPQLTDASAFLKELGE